MFYYNFRVFNYISTIFGLKKPFCYSSGEPNHVTVINKLWAMFIIVLLTTSFIFSVQPIEFSMKTNLENASKTNNFIVNIIILTNNLVNGERACIELYQTLNDILRDMKFGDKSIKLISKKLYLWLSIPTVIFTVFIILEIICVSPPYYDLLTRIPIFLSVVHLAFHLYLMLAILKNVNYHLRKLTLAHNEKKTVIPELEQKCISADLRYLFDPDINFIEVNEMEYFDLKFLCQVYDQLCTCLQLLEKYHGSHILLTVWLMFSGSVFDITLITCDQAQYPWLAAVRSILPFFWSLIGCYIEDQIRDQVEDTDTLIVKYLIDFRCDQSRRNILQTFKQLVGINRLQFTASGLFQLNYALILGTIMNVITYSIIMIQLFLST